MRSASPRENRFLFTGREHRRLGSLGVDFGLPEPGGRDERERTSQWLAETGLYDYRNRVYLPDLGRFLQTDPIRFSAGDANLYWYVGNNPISRRDPWGLDEKKPDDDENKDDEEEEPDPEPETEPEPAKDNR